MTSDATAIRPTSAVADISEDLVGRYVKANPPLSAGEVLPAIPDEFVAALDRVDGHDPAAFQQVLADFNINDAAALTTVLRVVRHYGATAALRWAGIEMKSRRPE